MVMLKVFATGAKESIVCDSSALISLAAVGHLPVLAFMRGFFCGEFIISGEVKRECVDEPLKAKSHTLTALRLQLALNDGVIAVESPRGLSRRADDVLWVANNMFYAGGRPLTVMHRGEAESVALALELGVPNLLIDERTTRMLMEKPELLRQHFGLELGREVLLNEKYAQRFRRMTEGLEAFRSSELLILAYERGYFARFGQQERHALEASLYSVKFAGCSIGFSEIAEYAKSFARRE